MKNLWNLSGKNAIIFGASQGIGRACAKGLSNAGCHVTAVARSEDNLKELVAEMDSISTEPNDFISLDINNHEELKSRLESLIRNRPIHILINNTGGPPSGDLLSAELAQFQNAFNQHILSAQIAAQVIVPTMKQEQYGRIINIISTSVKEPINGLGVSNTIRGAMGNWAKTLAGELAAAQITVNNILPGFTKTDRLYDIIKNRAEKANISKEKMEDSFKSVVPMARFADPEEIANAAVFLASPAASYITGINLPVDGGRTKSL